MRKRKPFVSIIVFMVLIFSLGIVWEVHSHNISDSSVKTLKYTIPLEGQVVNAPNENDIASKGNDEITEDNIKQKDDIINNTSADNNPMTSNTETSSNPESTNNITSNSQEIKDKPVTDNYKEFFKNDVFMGDSVTEGLSYYGYLDEARVCSEIGISVSVAKYQIDKIVALNPKNIFLLYGINDMSDTMPSQWLVDQYKELINYTKSKLPNSNICIESILPIMPFAEERSPYIKNTHINECNDGLINLAKQENVNFINIASILNDSNRYLFEGDGIHFKPAFYVQWLNYLQINIK